MDGFIYGFALSLIIFFLDSVLILYCLAKFFQLIGVKFLNDRAIRWSLILLLSFLVTSYLYLKFSFIDKFSFIVLIVSFFAGSVLKVIEHYKYKKDEQDPSLPAKR